MDTTMTLMQLLKPTSRVFLFQTHFFQINNPRPRPNFSSLSVFCSWSYEAQKIVREFDPKIPIEQAITPPSSWYTDPSFYTFELDRVFYRGWQAVGYTEQIKEPHDFFSGRLGNVEFVVCRDDEGRIAALHNVCRHHASLLVSGSGKKSCFTCPYHGWTYGLNGALRKATKISGIQNFNEFGLVPIKVATWGPFVLLNVDKEISPKDNIDTDSLASEWLGSSSEILSLNGIDSPLTYVCRREYIIECNWKVFCDNYLDGGYHVPFAHKGLASGLSLDSYTTSIFGKVSIQSVEGGSEEREDDRFGSKALYAFIYPNFMINRYGPWMDTNLVIPLGPRKCLVVFDYFLEASLKANYQVESQKPVVSPEEYRIHIGSKNFRFGSGSIFLVEDFGFEADKCLLEGQNSLSTQNSSIKNKDDKAFIERSLVDSERVQMEDITLCEGVQRGIESPAYSSGRYAPNVEKAMHHFHCLLYDNLIN